MKRILITFVALLLAVAFAYDPDPLTRLEIQAAAAFTDGIVTPCPGDPDPDRYYVCVGSDPSSVDS